MGCNDGDSTPADDLPPSCRYVLDVLDRVDGECSRQELLEETELPPDTLDDALARLDETAKIAKTRDPGDLRQVVVKTTTM